jgi:hypothetical protein
LGFRHRMGRGLFDPGSPSHAFVNRRSGLSHGGKPASESRTHQRRNPVADLKRREFITLLAARPTRT